MQLWIIFGFGMQVTFDLFFYSSDCGESRIVVKLYEGPQLHLVDKYTH